MNSRSRLRSIQLERCSQMFYEPILRDGLVVERKMNNSDVHNGCCNPTTSTSPFATTNSNSVTVISGHKSRGIVHSIIEKGTGRLFFEDNFTRMRGVLLNEYEESISISGTSTPTDPKTDPVKALLDSLPVIDSTTNPLANVTNGCANHTNTVHRTMTITIVDGEAGQKFCVENVDVMISARMVTPPSPPAASGVTKAPLGSPTRAAGAGCPAIAGTGNTASPQLWVEINHPAILFQTDDVFIGNRADVEIQKYLGSWGVGRLARANSRSGSNHHLPYSPSSSISSPTLVSPPPSALYVGAMAVNVVSMERTAPSMRRMSTCDGCTANIIERANDFLV